MKNIHLLSTEKPSRLFNCFGKLEIGDYTTIRENLQVTNPHIYITSDEEIKDGDWLIVNDEDVMQMKSSYDNDMSGEDIWVGDSLNGYATYKDNCKKIILTTDQNLINDGVQAIDDEFLEWFVKNPSCESVEVEIETTSIQLPQQQLSEKSYDLAFRWINKKVYKIIIPKEEPKQETLEEAIKREYETRKFNSDFPFDPQSFKLGAKWAQERMYSEEEVYSLLEQSMKDCHLWELEEHYSGDYKNLKEWFEQFKKK